jgi:hypothetical protein
MGTFSETLAVGAGVQAATPNLQGLSTLTDPLLNSEFSTVSTLNPGLGSIYGPRACPAAAGATELSPGFQSLAGVQEFRSCRIRSRLPSLDF